MSGDGSDDDFSRRSSNFKSGGSSGTGVEVKNRLNQQLFLFNEKQSVVVAAAAPSAATTVAKQQIIVDDCC
jgi:hypothetical protein